jgi:type VI secretion system protein ImpL
VEARFPFRRDANAPDVPMDDFVRLFGPGGVFDQFFAQNLRNFVDTTVRPWRPVAVDGLPPPVSAIDIAQFQRAAAIRDAFFPASLPGQAGAGLRFELMPTGLDPAATGATLEVEGNKVAIAPGAAGARPVLMQWPSRGAVTLGFEPSAGAPVVADGPWAAMRFVARGQLLGTATPDRFRLSLRQGDRAADFELRASSVVNPFALRELAEFRCPQLAP